MEKDPIEESGSPEESFELAIVRDGPLPRFSADNAVSAFLGRDVEIAFLTYTARLDAEFAVDGEMNARSVRLSSELLEVARVRMAPAGVRQMVLGLVQQLLDSRTVESEQLRTELDSVIRSASAVAEIGTR